MKTIQRKVLFGWLISLPSIAWGHGFLLNLNSNDTSFTAASQSQYLDGSSTPAPAADTNLFYETFDYPTPTNTPWGMSYYYVEHGFVSESGPFPGPSNFTATFNMISPLYFSDGNSGSTASGAATATAGTYIELYDRDFPSSLTEIPGTSPGYINISGATPFSSGFQVSLQDAHELAKELVIGTGSSQTYGEYGFAFDVKLTLSNGTVMTSGPLVDVFAVTDPKLGDFAENAMFAQQDTATLAIYNAAQASGAAVIGNSASWNGNANSTWANASNWENGTIPGSTSSVASNDTVVFYGNPTNAVPTIDAGRNIQTILFELGAGSLTLGTTAGNALLLTNGGSIQVTSTVTNPQVINAPLVLEGGNALYIFNSDSLTTSATLSFGGGITGGSAGNTVLKLGGDNTGPNTISGAVSNGSANSLALLESGPCTWVLSGSNTYTGGTTVNEGTLTVTPTGTLGASTSPLNITTMANGVSAVVNINGIQSIGSLSGTIYGSGNTATLNIAAGSTLLVNQTASADFGATLCIAAGTPTSFGTFALQGPNALEIDAAPSLGNNSAVNVDGGTLRFNIASGPATIGSAVTVTVASGATLELAGSVAAFNSSVNIVNNSQAANTGGLHITGTNQLAGQITGTGNTVVNANSSLTAYQIRQNSLTIGSGAMVTLSASGSGSTATPAMPNDFNFSSSLTSLSIAGTPGDWTGTLDIGNNGLVIAYGNPANDPYATIDNMIESGYKGGAWGGKGITSTLAQAGVAQNISTPLNIGLLDFTPGTGNFTNQTFTVFEGQTVTTNAILVRLTYMDDLVLAGDMAQNNSTSDALIFAANFGSGTTWSVGDLTHDGVINSNDALLFAANFTVGLPSLDGTAGAAAAMGGDAAAVPEPAAAALAILATCGFGLFASASFAKKLRP